MPQDRDLKPARDRDEKKPTPDREADRDVERKELPSRTADELGDFA